MTTTDGGSLDGWDDELNDWTEDDRVRDQAATTTPGGAPDLMAALVESMRLAAERRSHHDD